VGSSPKTSSPTAAVDIASSISGDGLVTVSDLKSDSWLKILHSLFSDQAE
jgi:hypothetical protein